MRAPTILLLLVLCPGVAAAQAVQQPASTPIPSPAGAYVGKRVVDVQFSIEGRPADDPFLRALIATGVGEPLSMAAVRESLSHLFSLGRFEDVQVDATDVQGGVRLLYNLVPVHNVSRVQLRGRLGLSQSQLRQAVTGRFGTAPPVGRAADVSATIEALYRDHGYLHPKVTWTPAVEHDPDRTVLTFDIDAGVRARIGEVGVKGETLVGRAAFLRQLNAAPADFYSPIDIRRGTDRYVQAMRKRGRYEATVPPPVAREGHPGVVDLAFDVQIGPAVTVTFEGDPLPSDRIAALVPVEREGSVDEDLVEDSALRITDYLHQQGYWKASVTPGRRPGDGTLALVFTVHKGAQYHVAAGGAQLTGNTALEPLRPLLAKLQPGDLFVEANLLAAEDAIRAVYRKQGFASVTITSAANESGEPVGGQGLVLPVIAIAEGPKTSIRAVTFEGNQAVSSAELERVANLPRGSAYYPPDVSAARDAVLLEYLNLGYATASVGAAPVLSTDGSGAEVVFTITEGLQTIVDHIIITGNSKTDPRVIRNELLFSEGGPLGLEAVMRSQQRLGELGLFRRIRISELPHAETARRDVLVTVEEAAATTLSYGGGAEISKRLRATGPNGEAQERYELAPRGFFDIGRRNIGGKNRSVNLYTRLSLRPSSDSQDDPENQGSAFGFAEYRVVGTYREPRPFGMKADFVLTGALEQGVRTSFNFARKGVTADLVRRLAPGVRLNARYSFNTTRTFDEQLSAEEQATIDRAFPQVRLSLFAGAISRDTRDDLLEPTRGTFVSQEASIAARALGGEVGFVKSYTQGFWFHLVPHARRTVFAARVAVGLANGFPRVVDIIDDAGNVTTDTVDDLPESERFFAGGDTTIRGFALDTVGAPNTISESGFPRGGNAVLIANAELRFPVWKDVGAAVFVDGGNVFARVPEFDFGELRGSVGFGLRYRSPVGPIRIDVGFKLDRREIGGTLESRRVIHFSIGQAF